MRRVDRKLAGILAIFMGMIGLHKFYLGKTVQGIIYILLSPSMITIFIGIIEGIIYLITPEEKFNEKYNKGIPPNAPEKWAVGNFRAGQVVWSLAIGWFLLVLFLGANKTKSSTSSVPSVSNTSISSEQSDKTPESPAETAASNESIPEKQAEKQARIGDVVSVGKFVYKVDGARFTKTIGNEFSSKTADGVFLVVKLTFKNLGKETQTLDNSLFKLTDEAGREFEASTEGNTEIEMSGVDTLFLKQCQPGIQKSGIVVFEVPDNTSTYKIHLSDGFWSVNSATVSIESK